jgi:signal transduction histidine kinase
MKLLAKSKPSIRITTLIVVFPLITLLLYGGLSHLFFFFAQHNEVKQELIKYEKTLMDAEKNNLKEKVDNLVQFIRYYDGRSSEKIKEDVKNIVNVTADIANNLYAEYKDTMPKAQLQKIIISALSKIKFEGDIGYLFLLDLQGNTLIHVDKKMVGTNILNIRDVKGKYIVKEFNKVLKENGEGFVDYYWYIVNEDRKEMHYKISFVKMLNCYDWYIGAGEYLKYMTRFVQKDILKYIKANAHFKHGYFFVFTSKNKIICYPDTTIHTEKLEKLKKNAFYKDSKYIAYTQYVPEYDWYITATKNLQEVLSNINEKKQNSQSKEMENIKTNLYLMMFTWLISILLSLYLSTVINRMLRSYEKRIHAANEKLIFQSRQALIGELFSMIAHQWRQPINKIASVLALLRFSLSEKKMNHEEIDAKCQEIEESIEFMSETIDDFRTFYQPKEMSEEVNLKELIDKSVDFLEGSIRKKHIEIVKELEEIHFVLYGNEFLQVMINLIKNAIDSIGREKGKIILQLHKREDNTIVVTVEDNGKGINEETLGRVFDPYFTTKEDSMGLGLYMTKIIIEKHMNGAIMVDMLPKGTKFTIYLYQKL